MGLESLQCCQTQDGMSISFEGGPGIGNHTRPLEEILYTQRGGKARRTGGGQNVIWPGEIVSHGFRSTLTEENRPGMGNFAQVRPRVPDLELEVLRGNPIGQLDSRIQARDEEKCPIIFKRLLGDFISRELQQLKAKTLQGLFCKEAVSRYQDG